MTQRVLALPFSDYSLTAIIQWCAQVMVGSYSWYFYIICRCWCAL